MQAHSVTPGPRRCVLNCCRSEKQTFGIEPSGIDQLESVRWQNAAGAEGGLSILGGAFVPEEKRRRCCGVVLCAAAGVLLLCVAALTGIFFIKASKSRLYPLWRREPLSHAHSDAQMP